jgi:Ca2+-binding EF-hand superfamily protein
VKAVVAVLCALMSAAHTRAADTDLLFPDGDRSARLRIEVSDAEPPEVAWTNFLTKLYDHFDRDANGSLSEAEVKRVFALPLPGGRVIAPDFAAMDANRDGKVQLIEFCAFYRERGFAPVTVVVRAAPADALALGDALFTHLDRDKDGKLSADELRQAVALLKRFDENEDEVLTAEELLGANRGARGAKPAGLKLAAEKGEPVAELKLALGGKPTLTSESKLFRLAEGSRLHVTGGICTLAVAKDDPAAGFRTAKNFYLAQFKAAAGDQRATRALFEDDPTTQVLAGLFDAADRDGDGKLARTGLEAFFDLVELGLACRVIVTVTDRGRNLFDLFDTNSDGRLDLGETQCGRGFVSSHCEPRAGRRGIRPGTLRRGREAETTGPTARPRPEVVRRDGQERRRVRVAARVRRHARTVCQARQERRRPYQCRRSRSCQSVIFFGPAEPTLWHATPFNPIGVRNCSRRWRPRSA